MIILEDSIFDKLVNFSKKQASKIKSKYDSMKTDWQKELTKPNYAKSNESMRSRILYQRLENKKNLEQSLGIWVEALLVMNNPFGSELYDFIMNSESTFDSDVANVIVKLFRQNRWLTAEIALDKLNLDNPEYTESDSRIADLIKEVKDYKGSKGKVDKKAVTAIAYVLDMDEDEASEYLKSESKAKIKEDIALIFKDRMKLTQPQIELLKTSNLLEPSKEVLEILSSETYSDGGVPDFIFLGGWETLITEWLSKNETKNTK